MFKFYYLKYLALGVFKSPNKAISRVIVPCSRENPSCSLTSSALTGNRDSGTPRILKLNSDFQNFRIRTLEKIHLILILYK